MELQRTIISVARMENDSGVMILLVQYGVFSRLKYRTFNRDNLNIILRTLRMTELPVLQVSNLRITVIVALLFERSVH